MLCIQEGCKVRVSNSGNSYWGEVGTVRSIRPEFSFDIVTVGFPKSSDPMDGESLVDLAETELELMPV